MKRIFTLILILSFSNAFAFFNYKELVQKYHNSKKPKKSNIKKGGAMDGGGTGGIREEEGAAWFYQDKSSGAISVCIKRSPKFKASLSDIKQVIQVSFNTWDAYIQQANIYHREDDNGNQIPYPKNLKILTRIKFEKCSPNTELTFYFGLKDKRVNEVLSGLNSLKGFAFRKYEDIDSINGTSKGIVWIFDPVDTPEDISDDIYFDWSQTKYLQAIVNHEVGHIMGVGHYSNTIMQQDLKDLFILSKMTTDATTPEETRTLILNSKKYLTQIDHKAKLVENFNFRGQVYTGMMGIKGSKDLEDSFKFFMKRSPKGDVTVQLRPATTNASLWKYTIKDDLSSKDFEITKLDRDVTTFSFGEVIPNKFKRVRKIFDPIWNFWEIDSDNVMTLSANLRGTMHIKGMKPFYAILGINPGVTGYFENADDQSTTISSVSTLSLHFIDKLMKTRIMYVDEIANWDFVDDDTDDASTDVIRIKP